MNGKEVKDPRFCPRPHVRSYRQGRKIKIACVLLTPFRLTLIQECIHRPLCASWRFCLGLYVIHWILVACRVIDVFQITPFSQATFLSVMMGLLAVWLIERYSRFGISRSLFGRSIEITITPEKVRIGGWLFGKRYPRAYRAAFALIPFDTAKSPIYQSSRLFCLVIGDVRRIAIAEVFDIKLAGMLVNNANVALTLSSQLSETECDPTLRRLAAQQ